jgi:hypothetical protein
VFQPADYFTLHDICLWSTSLKREAEYEPECHDGKCIVQTMRSFSVDHYRATLDKGEDEDLLRVLVTLGLRTVTKEEKDVPEKVLHALEATFAVEYFVNKQPDEENFRQFVEFNCLHNAWPFWRQHVYDTLKRASLPVPAVPLFSGKPSGKPKKKIRKSNKVD